MITLLLGSSLQGVLTSVIILNCVLIEILVTAKLIVVQSLILSLLWLRFVSLWLWHIGPRHDIQPTLNTAENQNATLLFDLSYLHYFLFLMMNVKGKTFK